MCDETVKLCTSAIMRPAAPGTYQMMVGTETTLPPNCKVQQDPTIAKCPPSIGPSNDSTLFCPTSLPLSAEFVLPDQGDVLVEIPIE